MKAFIFVFVTSLFFSPLSFCKEQGKDLSLAEQASDGCPSNSYCTLESSKARKTWVNFLDNLSGTAKIKIEKIEDYRKKNGIPLSAWMDDKSKKEKDLIYWDSRCLHHQKENSHYYIFDLMGKNLSELKERNFYFDQGYTIIKDNRVRSYIIPREEYPLYMEEDDLVFLREDEGIYYGLKVKPSAEMTIIEPINLQSDDYAKEVECPTTLITFVKNKEKNRTLYQGQIFCKSVKNIKTKEFQTFLFQRPCS